MATQYGTTGGMLPQFEDDEDWRDAGTTMHGRGPIFPGAVRRSPRAAMMAGDEGAPAEMAPAPRMGSAPLRPPTRETAEALRTPADKRTPQQTQMLRIRAGAEAATMAGAGMVANPISDLLAEQLGGQRDQMRAQNYVAGRESALPATAQPPGAAPASPAGAAPAPGPAGTAPAQAGKPLGYAMRTMPDGSVRTIDSTGSRRDFAGRDDAVGFYRPEEVMANRPLPKGITRAPQSWQGDAPVTMAPPPTAVPVAAATATAPAAAGAENATPAATPASPAAPSPAPASPVQDAAAARTTAPTTQAKMTQANMEKPAAPKDSFNIYTAAQSVPYRVADAISPTQEKMKANRERYDASQAPRRAAMADDAARRADYLRRNPQARRPRDDAQPFAGVRPAQAPAAPRIQGRMAQVMDDGFTPFGPRARSLYTPETY